jgi:regulator of nucleoside diphosphate kinase
MVDNPCPLAEHEHTNCATIHPRFRHHAGALLARSQARVYTKHDDMNMSNELNTMPEVVVSSVDASRLEKLLASLPARSVSGREALEAELARARIVDPKDMPPNVVTMNSEVRFRILSSDTERCLRLVYPKDADDSGGTVSVLAPIGGALLGLSCGDEIDWPAPGGATVRVRIEEVTYQPERSGELHR